MRLHVIDRDGGAHAVDASCEGSLMETLRDLEYGVAAICGGVCSCASCHVYVAPEWFVRLPPQGADEQQLLSALGRRSALSRLACQVPLHAGLDGLSVTLAPEE
jgi:ferredoxin, 2Fe-2S